MVNLFKVLGPDLLLLLQHLHMYMVEAEETRKAS